jgi:hypothetical protein
MASELAEAVEHAYDIGDEHGVAAAGRWLQGNLGDTARDDIARVARWVRAGIEAGDGSIYAALPQPNLRARRAEGYTATRLYADVKWSANDDPGGSIPLAYASGFEHAVEHEVTRYCRQLLSKRGLEGVRR